MLIACSVLEEHQALSAIHYNHHTANGTVVVREHANIGLRFITDFTVTALEC